MDALRYRRIKDVLFGALAREGTERAAFLDAECADDAELRSEVERLLGHTTVATDGLVPHDAARAVTQQTALTPPCRLGPFELRRIVGRGGMGTVYEAFEGGERIALKLVHTHLVPEAAPLERFRREAELGGLVAHENVVAVRGLHTVADGARVHHALAMEYVEGESLRAFLRTQGRVPEALLRELAAQIAAGLTAIHAAGVVHRDLKPENVLLTPDHRVRITDLGVARLVNASIALTRTGQFVGSLAYAAPEQFSSEDVGPSADLYGLGVLLHELATGTNPFERGDVAAVIRAHLDVVPPLLSDAGTECSRFFSAVVARLLAKDPAQRFAGAHELLRVLEEGEGGAWWTRHSAEHARRRGARVPVRRDTSLHGRGDELRRLRNAWEDACAGRGGTVLLEGEAGIGKTRLVDAFLHELEGADVTVLYGSHPPSGGQRALCQGLLATYGRHGVEAGVARYCAPVASLVPAFAAMVRDDLPPQGAAPLDTDAVLVVCRHLLAGMAAERPTVWVFDDVHFAPAEARAVALALARTAPDHRALLVLTARPKTFERERAALWNVPGFVHVALGRLATEDVVELLREAFGDAVLADRIGPRVAQRTDGVPFFVFETLRALEEQRVVERGADGTFQQRRPLGDLEVPSAVRDLIAARLADLTREERAILDVAAVVGHEFDAQVVAPVLGQRIVGVLRELAEVERRHGVVRAAGRAHRFDHHQFQEVVYAELPEALRAEYHALLAEHHAERVRAAGREPTGADAQFLARHHLEGPRPAAALPYLPGALDHLERRALLDDAIALAGRALAIPDLVAGVVRIDLLLRTADAAELLSRHTEQETFAREALAAAEALGDTPRRARAHHALGEAHLGRSEMAAAVAQFERAAALAAEAGARTIEARATNSLGTALSMQARHSDARRVLERCLTVARETGDDVLSAYALTNLGAAVFQGERDDTALGLLREGLATAVASGDGRAEAYASHRLGGILLSTGHTEESRPYFERAIALSDASGHRGGALMSRGNLGLVHLDFGRLGRAREQFLAQLRAAEELEHVPALGQATANLGLLDLALGCPEDALLWTERALGYAHDARNPRAVQHVLRLFADVLRRLGRLDEAAARARESLEVSRAAGDPAHEGEVWTELAAQALARRDLDAARTCSAEAVRLLRELGAAEQLLFAELWAAQLPGADTSAARELFERVEKRFGLLERILCRWLLWRATSDASLVPEARRMIEFCRDEAPAAYRESIVRGVPAHRELLTGTPRA